MTPADHLLDIRGEHAQLVERLREPLVRALKDRGSFYSVRVETIGRVGEVLVRITGSRGHVPLLFASDELEPGYVFRMVEDIVTKFAL